MVKTRKQAAEAAAWDQLVEGLTDAALTSAAAERSVRRGASRVSAPVTAATVNRPSAGANKNQDPVAAAHRSASNRNTSADVRATVPQQRSQSQPSVDANRRRQCAYDSQEIEVLADVHADDVRMVGAESQGSDSETYYSDSEVSVTGAGQPRVDPARNVSQTAARREVDPPH